MEITVRKKNHTMKFRATEEEKKKIDRDADKAGFRSRAEYMRYVILSCSQDYRHKIDQICRYIYQNDKH